VGRAAHELVPVVPTAVLFDLGRGGNFANRPDAEFGRRAAATAQPRAPRAGTVGAGTGAVAGGLKGGVGHAATAVLDGAVTVAALAVVNSAGAVVDPDSGLPWERHPSWPLRRPDAADRRRLREHLAALAAARQSEPTNTTIGVVAVDTHLTKAECTKLAQAAQAGLARAARPSHLMVDGDTVFALATGDEPLLLEAADPAFRAPDARPALLNVLMAAAADCFAAACVDAVAAATGTAGIPAYRDLCPSAFAKLSP
jgi:putative pantetheine hydrolase